MEPKLTKKTHVGSASEQDSERTGQPDWLVAKMDSLNNFFHVLGGAVAYFLMVALFVVGFWEISKGIYLVFFGSPSVPEGVSSRESAALEISLKGLEFLFLAPLTYLTLLSLERYVAKTYNQSDHESARLQLINIKISIISLMIAIIATDLVAKILKNALTYQATFTEGLVIVILGTYLFCLERLVTHSSKGNNTP